MKCSLFTGWGLLGALACSAYLSAHAAEYCLRPDKEDGTQANSVICCATPAGWQGWKDDPHYWDGMSGFNRQLIQAEHMSRVLFRRMDCKVGPKCPFLALETIGRDSRGQPDVEAGMRNFLEQVQQRQGERPTVTRLGAFDARSFGTLPISQICCESGNCYLLTVITQRDVMLTISLEAPNMKNAEAELESLKQLARSVQIADASSTLPDIIKIDVRLPDQRIKDELLRLTPLGTRRQNVYEFLESRLYKDSRGPDFPGKMHWAENGDLYIQIGSYGNPVPTGPVPRPTTTTDEAVRSQPQVAEPIPPTTVAKAFWKFDSEHKLRDIEVERSTVEIKPKQ